MLRVVFEAGFRPTERRSRRNEPRPHRETNGQVLVRHGSFRFLRRDYVQDADERKPVIELFTFGSTNGHKIAIALEELGLPYETHTVNVFAGEGQSPEFLALNPT